jgi:hypothetical protein
MNAVKFIFILTYLGQNTEKHIERIQKGLLWYWVKLCHQVIIDIYGFSAGENHCHLPVKPTAI